MTRAEGDVGGRVPLWVMVVAVVAIIGGALGALAVFGGASLPARTAPPIEELAVERTVLTPGSIEIIVRNTGPDPVQVAQAFVNDTYVDVDGASAPIGRLGTQTLELRYPWISGQPYTVSLMTSSGLVIEHRIPVATPTPPPGPRFFGLMALLGIYVGVIPVLLGMLVLPVLRRAGRGPVRVLLALTVGLLLFLAVDAALEGFDLAAAGGGVFGGPLLVLLGAGLAFLALTTVDRVLARRARAERTDGRGGVRLALMIAIGIGLHNLGEGLIIGSAYAVGALALGTALIVGFALHNTTEGVAIVAPLADRRTSLPQLLGLGLVAGAPAIVGAVIGGTVVNPTLSALLFGVGVGAVLLVMAQIAPGLRARGDRGVSAAVLGGLAAGLLLMYGTGLLVPA